VRTTNTLYTTEQLSARFLFFKGDAGWHIQLSPIPIETTSSTLIFGNVDSSFTPPQTCHQRQSRASTARVRQVRSACPRSECSDWAMTIRSASPAASISQVTLQAEYGVQRRGRGSPRCSPTPLLDPAARVEGNHELDSLEERVHCPNELVGLMPSTTDTAGTKSLATVRGGCHSGRHLAVAVCVPTYRHQHPVRRLRPLVGGSHPCGWSVDRSSGSVE